MRVLDVAAGTGNASIPAAAGRRGRHRQRPDARAARSGTAPGRRRGGRRSRGSRPTPSTCPSTTTSFDVVISSIGAMFAPHHQETADELVRVCRPGGTIGLLSWTPEGMIGALLRTIGPFAPPPPPGAQPPPLWGSEAHLLELFGAGVDFVTPRRDVLEVTAFERPRDFGEHFKARYGPTIAAQANARGNGRDAEFEAALDRFCDDWNRGTARTRALRAASTCSPSAPGPDRAAGRRRRPARRDPQDLHRRLDPSGSAVHLPDRARVGAGARLSRAGARARPRRDGRELRRRRQPLGRSGASTPAPSCSTSAAAPAPTC